ncbi:MAG TPA: DUF2110 family protein [Candidatus Acidoferrum sp.]|nr:DUF2110 family protein [Candidatus Acidoferrum sp.]
MHAATLLIKAYNRSQLGMIKEVLKSDLEGLNAEVEVSEVASHGWVRIIVSGEDETTALNYLTREFGRCPERLESVEKFSEIRGRITTLGKSNTHLSVDIGVLSPPMVEATISLLTLQGQIVDGRKVALAKLIELFGFCDNLPLNLKILSVNIPQSHVEAMLSEKQLLQYANWTKSLLHRLIILGARLHDVELAVEKTGCNRDIVSIDSLGLLEHTLVCKLGTDAAGLIPKIGRRLPHAALTVFNPNRIMEFLNEDSALLAS